MENARSRDQAQHRTAAVTNSDMPDLPVVRATAEPSATTGPAPDADDGEVNRPLIVGEGSRIETRVNAVDNPTSPPRRTKDKAAPDSQKKSSATNETGKK
jgi:hypothetical protein